MSITHNEALRMVGGDPVMAAQMLVDMSSRVAELESSLERAVEGMNTEQSRREIAEARVSELATDAERVVGVFLDGLEDLEGRTPETLARNAVRLVHQLVRSRQELEVKIGQMQQAIRACSIAMTQSAIMLNDGAALLERGERELDKTVAIAMRTHANELSAYLDKPNGTVEQ